MVSYYAYTYLVAVIIQLISYSQSNCKDDLSLCGICGICKKRSRSENDSETDYYCDTKFTKSIFSGTPPNCTFVDKCKRMKCLNRGICISKKDQYNCHCRPGFYGYKCQNKITLKRGMKQKVVLQPAVFVYYEHISYALNLSNIIIVLDKMHDTLQVTLNRHDLNSYIFTQNDFVKGNPRQNCISQKLLPLDICTNLPTDSTYYYVTISYSLPILHYIPSKMDKQKFDPIIDNDEEKSFLGYKVSFELNIWDLAVNPSNLLRRNLYILKIYSVDFTCAPRISVTNCGASVGAVHFYRKDNINMESNIHTPRTCKRYNTFFKWIVMQRQRDEKHSVIYKYEDHLYINPFELPVGKYEVVLLVTATILHKRKDLTKYNFVQCYFDLNRRKLEPYIKGGDYRNHYEKNDLVLDSSGSVDPNELPNRQTHLLFIWSCDKEEDFCKDYATKSTKYVVKAHFKKGSVYKFRLALAAANMETQFAYQTVSITSSAAPDIMIMCLRNCGMEGNYHINSKKLVYLQVQLIRDDELPNQSVFNWYEKSNRTILLVEDSHILIISPHAITDGVPYSILVKRIDVPGEASFQLKVGCHPHDGKCKISPKHGVYAQTKFQISCGNFTVKKSTSSICTTATSIFNYHFHNMYHLQKSIVWKLGSKSSGDVSFNTSLLEEVVRISVEDSNIPTYVFLNVTLDRTKFNASETLRTILGNQKEIVNEKEFLFKLAAVVGAMKDSEKDYIYQSISSKLNNLIEKQTTFSEIAMKLVSILEKIVNAYRRDSEVLSTHIGRSMCSKMLKLSKLYLEHNREKAIIYFRRTPPPTLGIEREEAFTTLITILAIISEILKVTFDRERQFNDVASHEIKIIIENAVQCLENLMTASSLSLLPDEHELRASMNEVDIWVKVYEYKNFEKLNQMELQTSLVIKFTPRLVEELRQYGGSLVLQFLVIQKNIYQWCNREIPIETEVAFVYLFVRNINIKYSYNIKRLDNPLNIYFPLKPQNRAILSGKIVARIKGIKDDDLWVRVYRLDNSAISGYGQWRIKFKNLKPDENFKIAVFHGTRPDFKQVTEIGFNISAKRSKTELPFYSYSSEVYTYIGILPGDNVAPGTSVNYTVEVYLVQCLHRGATEWNSEGCKVGEYSQDELLLCYCTHLSMFGAAVFTTPTKMDPFVDISVFATAKDTYLTMLVVLNLLIVYIHFLIWTRLVDKNVKAKQNVIVLDDNYPGEKYAYLVNVHTGYRFNAGTTSKAAIQLYGLDSRSRAHVLCSKEYHTLQTRSNDWFIIFTKQYLNELQYIHIWCNQSGPNPNWYCEKIVIYDLTSNDKYNFTVEKWFSLRENECTEAIVYPESSDYHRRRYWMFIDNIYFGFKELHLWLSISLRSKETQLSSCQRLTVIACMVMGTVSICCNLFILYKDKHDINVLSHQEFTIARIIVGGVQSAVLTSFIPLGILYLFTKSFPLNTSVEQKLAKEQNQEDYELQSTEEAGDKEQGNRAVLQKLVTGTSALWSSIKNKLPVVTLSKFSVCRVPKSLKLHCTPKHWWIFTWTLCEVTILLSAVSVVIQSYQLRESTIQDYLIAAVLSLSLNALLVPCIKIILYSSVMAFFYKKYLSIQSVKCDLARSKRTEFMGDVNYLNHLVHLRSKAEYFPLSEPTVNRAHMRQFDKHGIRILVKAVFELLFVIITFMTLYTAWYGTNNYYLCEHIKNIFTNGQHPPLTSFRLSDINSIQFYLTSVIGSNLFTPPMLSHSDNDSHAGFCGLKLLSENVANSCKDTFTEDQSDYINGWTEDSSSSYASPWKYENNFKSNTLLYSPTGKLYKGNGYIAVLAREEEKFSKNIAELFFQNWVNNYTEILEINFILLNVNSGMVVLTTVLMENVAPLGMRARIKIMAIPYGENHWAIWENIFLGFLAFMILTYVVNVLRYGLNYFWTHGNFIYHCLTLLGIAFLVTHCVADYSVVDYIQRSQRYGIDTISTTRLISDVYFEIFTRTVCCLIVMFCVLLVFKSFIFKSVILRCYYMFVLLKGKITCLVALSYIFIHVETKCVWFDLVTHPNLFVKLPTSLMNAFTGQQVIANATDPSDHVALVLYPLFCGTILCFSCVMIVHHYGLAQYYTRNIFHIGSLHKSCYKKIHLFCKRITEKCHRHVRLRGGCNMEKVNQSFIAEERKLEKEAESGNLKVKTKHYITEKRKTKHYIITKGINSKLNTIVNKLNQPDILV